MGEADDMHALITKMMEIEDARHSDVMQTIGELRRALRLLAPLDRCAADSDGFCDDPRCPTGGDMETYCSLRPQVQDRP